MGALSKFFSSLSSPSRSSTAKVVGIDIGSSAIKVVELEDRKGVLTLTTYGETQLGPYDGKEVGQSVALSAENEQQALVDVLRESAVKARQAVLAIPLTASFVTVMSLVSREDEDLGPRIRVEARKYIPTQISEVTLDWAEIPVGKDTGGKRDVLVAAIQNDALKRFNALTNFVGFERPPSEIECFSTLRALYREDEAASIVIDVGAVSTKLYVVRGGLLQRMHRVRMGGALCTKRLAEVLEVSFDEAELTKRTAMPGHARYKDIVRVHRSCYERQFKEFKQVLQDYEQSTGVTIPVVHVCGGGAVFPEVPVLIKEFLGKEVVPAAAFSKVAYPAFMEDLMQKIGPTFSVALGAALRAFD